MRKTVTIRDGWVQVSTRELTGIIDTSAATFPGYGSIPFILDEDFNIAPDLSLLRALAISCSAIRRLPQRQT